VAYGEGLWINQAFSLDVAFRLGMALLRERPGLMLGLGTALWLLTSLPTLVSLPGSFTAGILEGTGDPTTASFVDLGSNLLSFGTWLLVFPFQWFVTTGGLRAIARIVESDEQDISVTWTSYAETAWVIVFRILYTLVLVLVLGAAFTPFVLIGAALAAQGSVEGLAIMLILGTVVLLVAYLWVGLPLALGTLACAIDGVTAMDAFPIGWEAGQGARATLFVFGLVFGFLQVVGMCVFCVGQIPVLAVALGACAGGWVLYSRPEATLRRSAFLQRHLPDLT
jgi:hypothetical protein